MIIGDEKLTLFLVGYARPRILHVDNQPVPILGCPEIYLTAYRDKFYCVGQKVQ